MESVFQFFPLGVLLLILICGVIAAVKMGVPSRDMLPMFGAAVTHLLGPDVPKTLWEMASRFFALVSFAAVIAALSPYVEKAPPFALLHSLCTLFACVAFGAYAAMITNRSNIRIPHRSKKAFAKGRRWDFAIVVMAGAMYYWFIWWLSLEARGILPSP